MTTLAVHSGYLTMRSIRWLLRQPFYIAVTLVQPLVWLLLFGQLFGRVVELPGFTGGNYADFLVPGVVIMTALFASGWTGVHFIEDMERGILNRMLTTPVRRGAMIIGTLSYQAVITVVQSIIIVGIGWLIGARYPNGPASILVTILAALIMAAAFGSMSIALALVIRTVEAVIGVAQFLVLPLTFLSSAIIATEVAPVWIQRVAAVNPVDWSVSAAREAMSAAIPDWGYAFSRLGFLCLVALALGVLATLAFRSYQRTV
ncbi:ABC transporter permease [Nonomuraea sp. NPDC059007]|uniref:ABC transporter permease n=1 Tax=Nonomuraea sp. NPDC059007 TaxID=3346692 RepID=UPI00367FC8F5